MIEDDLEVLVDEMATRDRAGVIRFLAEFRERAYLSGRHMLIDAIRSNLDSFDDRTGRK